MRTNNDRSARAERAVQAYADDDTWAYQQESLETKLTDLLTDLRHLADNAGEDFHAMLDSSYLHYCAELEEQRRA